MGLDGGIMCYVDTALYEGESILLPRKGTLNNIMYVNEKFWTVDTMYWTEIDESIAYPKYLYLYLSQLDLSWLNTGSGVPSMTNSAYNMIPVSLPNKAIQVKVADQAFAIYEKIHNNKTIIEELEQTLSALYNYWFVQFDFPNEEGKPYRASGGEMVWNEELGRDIPEGWDASSVGKLAGVATGKEDAVFATSSGIYPFFTCSSTTLRCDKPSFDGHAVLIAGNGDFNVKHYTGSFNAYQRTYVVMPNDKAHYALIYLSAIESIASLTAGSVGSIVKFIRKGDVENIPVAIPNDTMCLSVLNQILEAIESYRKENEELVALRDWILPMLMSGQVKVSK